MASDLEIAQAVCGVFASVEALHAKGLPDARGSRVRREAVHFLWELRDQSKLAPERPHSAAARRQRQTGDTTDLRYEHAIPLATFMPTLRAAVTGGPEAMLSALRRFVRPVIVVDAECRRLTKVGLAASMPAAAAPDDPVARYRAAGIALEARDVRLLLA